MKKLTESAKLLSMKIDEIVITPDFRAPNNIRLGLSPLYNSFQEVWTVADSLVNIVKQKSYLKYKKSISGVT